MNSASKQKESVFPVWSIVVYLLVISISVDAAFAVSSAFNLGLFGTLITVVTAGVLTGGALFTAMELRKLRR